MKKESAFPVADTVANGERYEPINTGLTKLEYFAGLAMQSILNSPISLQNNTNLCNEDYAAIKAIKFANALIKQLENV